MYGHARTSESQPRGSLKFTILQFFRLFHGHNYYILCLSDRCKGANFNRNNVFSLYDIWQRIAKDPLPRGGIKFTILIEPSLLFITIHLVCLKHASEQNRDLLKIYNVHQFNTFLPKNYLLLGWGVMKFIISCLLSLQMLYTKFG